MCFGTYTILTKCKQGFNVFMQTSDEFEIILSLTVHRSSAITDVLADVKEAFDNKVTPFFALFICCWGEYLDVIHHN